MIVPPIVIGLSTIIYIILAVRLYREYGWVVFKLVGASPNLKRELRQCVYSGAHKQACTGTTRPSCRSSSSSHSLPPRSALP